MDEYELDELGNPILDELGNPKLKKTGAPTASDTDELGNPTFQNHPTIIRDPREVVARQLYQGFGDQIPKSFALASESLATGVEGGSNIKDLVKQRGASDFQKYVRGGWDSPYEFEGAPEYSGFKGYFLTPFDFEDAWAKYGDQYVKDAGLAPVAQAAEQRFQQEQLPRRLAVNKYAERQDAEAAETMGDIPQSYKDVKDFTGGVNYATNLASQQLWQIPLTVATRGLSGTIMESAEVYDQQLELLAQKNGISREEVIRRGLDAPHVGQLYAIAAGQLDRLSAGQLVNTVRKGGFKAAQAALNIASETATEPTQGILEEAGAASGAGEEFDFMKSLTSPKRIDEALGGLLGSSASTVAGAANTSINREDSGSPEVNDVIDADTNEAITNIVNAASESAVNNEAITAEEAENVQTNTTESEKVANVSEQSTLGEQLVGKEEVVESEPAIEPVPTADLVKQFNEEGALLGATEESKKETKAVAVEQIADFLRGKVSSRGQVIDFVEQWNQLHPERPLTDADGNRAWNLIKPVKPQPSNETVTQTTAEALKNQIKTFYRGIDKGVRKGQKLVNENLIPKVQEALKTANLTARQASAILTKLKRTNLFTPGSFNKLNTYIDKVVADANYADKEQQAYELRSKIKAKAKTLPPNLKTVVKDFSSLDPEYFGSLDEYLAVANEINNGLLSPKEEGYKPINEFKTLDKINKARNEQEKAKSLELISQGLKDFEEFDVDNIDLEDTSIEEALAEKQEKRDQVFNELNAKAKFAKIGLEDYDTESLDESEKATVDELLNAETDSMTIDDLIAFIKVADNILINDNFSGSGKLSTKLQAKRNMEDALKLTEPIKQKGKLGTTSANVFSTGQILDVLFNSQRVAAEIKRLLGIGGILSKGSIRNTIVGNHLKALGDTIKAINKKYKNKPDVRNKEEQWKLNMLGVMARNTDGVSHLPKIKANLQTDINSRKASDPKYAAKLQEYFDEYKDVQSSEEAIERFKKKDPQIHELWSWYQENIFTEDFAKQTKRNTNNLYNQAFIIENNYWPYSIKSVDSSTKSAEDQRATPKLSLKPQQSSNTLAVTRSVPVGFAYNDNAISAAMIAYSKTLYDNIASKDVQLLHEMSKRPEFNKLIGAEGNSNRQKLISALEHSVAEQYGNVERDNDFMKLINDFTAILNDLGRAKALGNLTQIGTQVAPTLTAAAINLGKYFYLVAIPTPNSFVKDVIGKTTLSEAGQRHGGTDIGDTSKTYLSEENDKKIQRVADNLRRAFNDLANWKLSIALTKGDVFARKRSFTAFYVKRLIELGVNPKEINLSTEGEKQTDQKRIKARAYAEHMVSTLQVPTNRAEMGAILRKKGGVETLRHIFLAFSVFPINTKIRLGRAVNKLGTKEGQTEFTAVLAESAMFTAAKIALAATWGAMLKELWRKVFQVEEPEKEDKEEDFWAEAMSSDPEWVDFARKMATGMVNDVSPISIGFGTEGTTHLTNYSAYLLRDMEEYGELSYPEWIQETRGLINAPFESEFSDLGVLGVGLQQMKDMGDATYDAAATKIFDAETINLNTAFGEQEVDTEDVDDLIAANALVEWLSIISPTDFTNAYKTVYREQLKDYTPTKKRERRRRLQK